MITKAMQKGLDVAVAGADLDACAAQVNFAQDVVKLNTKQAELDRIPRVTRMTSRSWSETGPTSRSRTSSSCASSSQRRGPEDRQAFRGPKLQAEVVGGVWLDDCSVSSEWRLRVT